MSRTKKPSAVPEATGFLVADGNGGFTPATAQQLIERIMRDATATGQQLMLDQ